MTAKTCARPGCSNAIGPQHGGKGRPYKYCPEHRQQHRGRTSEQSHAARSLNRKKETALKKSNRIERRIFNALLDPDVGPIILEAARFIDSKYSGARRGIEADFPDGMLPAELRGAVWIPVRTAERVAKGDPPMHKWERYRDGVIYEEKSLLDAIAFEAALELVTSPKVKITVRGDKIDEDALEKKVPLKNYMTVFKSRIHDAIRESDELARPRTPNGRETIRRTTATEPTKLDGPTRLDRPRGEVLDLEQASELPGSDEAPEMLDFSVDERRTSSPRRITNRTWSDKVGNEAIGRADKAIRKHAGELERMQARIESQRAQLEGLPIEEVFAYSILSACMYAAAPVKGTGLVPDVLGHLLGQLAATPPRFPGSARIRERMNRPLLEAQARTHPIKTAVAIIEWLQIENPERSILNALEKVEA